MSVAYKLLYGRQLQLTKVCGLTRSIKRCVAWASLLVRGS